MSDLKLFRTTSSGVAELPGGAMALEKSLQTLCEANLEALLGVRFLASEFVTNEGGRMDTLGIDENNAPVVIEYKRASNENVINQGLFYLDWLMGHRKDFEWLVMDQLGKEVAQKVDWSGSRLICVAGDFQKWDEHAVKQMNRTIDLVRYRRYGDDLLLLEQLTATTARSAGGAPAPLPMPTAATAGTTGSAKKQKTVTQNLAEAPPALRDLYHAVADHLQAAGDDVQVKTTDLYIAFRRLKNFACVELRNQIGKVLVFVKVDPDAVTLEPGFTRDVRGIGHYGTGDLEITIQSMADLEKAKPIFDNAYQNG
jgi:predicted transport protein